MRPAVLAAVLGACGGGAIKDGDDTPVIDDAAIDAPPPVPAGCITDVSTGDHVYTCGGLRVDARIPAKCQAPGCGLILELHGDTGSGLLMDAHTNLRALGEQHDYIVIAPSGPPWPGGPGSTWNLTNDATLVAMTQQFRDVFRVNARKIHVTGFSRGGFMTWRLICDHSELFASAAPAGAGFGDNFGEETCFQNNRKPQTNIPILFMMGRTDASVGYQTMVGIRDAALASYGLSGPGAVISSDTNYKHTHAEIPLEPQKNTIIETFDHAYETVSPGPFASAKGHCIAGSTSDPQAPQYAIPCKLPNAFVWGEEVIKFFEANPRR